MNGVPPGAIIAILGALVLVGGGLWRRGIPAGRLTRLGLMWAVIIAVVWLAIALMLKPA